MATIYRFIVEEGTAKSGSGGRKSGGSSKKKSGKTITALSALGTGGKGGVEHNRKLRAINPLLNRVTGGYWEKGMRVGRAGLGLVKFKKMDNGSFAFAGLSTTAIAIIISFAIQTAMKHHAKLIERTEQENKRAYKRLETGVSAVHGNYSVTQDYWSGKISYNENK